MTEIDKLALLSRLNIILAIQNTSIHLDISPMMNYSGIEIEKFVRWPKDVDFTDYDYTEIIKDATSQQKKLTSYDMASGNFEILQCLKNHTIDKYSFEKYLQLYEENKEILDMKYDY
ncbi:hypothetical protein MP478_16450 [Chryseobacterium sp. WG14]|uniref:hypothetical protein n=1 Tax=Chryseobacterium sp. WG14 TaxID=2926909 RepID=UPI00211ED0DF|nr:hypothetical protein [Chryseobacterium sp. WG14]MCQ9640976.1 hypothetical protein [Chryseobacterium sp. WG14]